MCAAFSSRVLLAAVRRTVASIAVLHPILKSLSLPFPGKTLLARELANALGARPPQIVNGPEILDKFVGEAEKKVRIWFECRHFRECSRCNRLDIFIERYLLSTVMPATRHEF